jgi:hypothetical protein
MFINARLSFLLFALLLCTPQISAQEDTAPTVAGDGEIHLDVVVTPKSGPLVSGLQQQDFTIWDNEVPQTITSFKAVDGPLLCNHVIFFGNAALVAEIDGKFFVALHALLPAVFPSGYIR